MKARLLESREIAPDVRHFVFNVPEVDRFDYKAGQFVSFTADIAGKAITRAYSLASAPNGNRFELCLNRVREGIFSPYLFDLVPGATVDFKGPYGVFVLRDPASPSVMVATGTGIAPFRGMLQQNLAALRDMPVTLIFGVRYQETLLYREEFELMARTYPNFRFWPTLTRPGTEWSGRTGRVQQHLREALGERRDLDVYVCGLRPMVDDVRTLLKEMGFDRRRIIYERFD